MFDLMTDVNLQIDNKNLKAKFIKTDILKQSVNPLSLSNTVNNRGIVKNNNIFTVNNTLSDISQSYEDISNKLSFIINNNIQDIKINTSNGICLEGKIQVRGDRFTNFKTNFKNANEMKQFYEFIDDLHFLKSTVAEQIKSKFSKSGNIRFYYSSKSQITKDNIKNHYSDVVKEYHTKLYSLKNENTKLRKSISQVETQISSKQFINDINNSKIEEFSLSKNNLINALKYYYIQRENSIYNRLTNKFSKKNDNRSEDIFSSVFGSDSSNSSNNDSSQINNHILRASNDKEQLKNTIIELTNEVIIEQETKRKLYKKYNTLKSAHKRVENNEEILKYVLQKINQNSSSILGIIRYRKQIIKDLKIYGFKIATI